MAEGRFTQEAVLHVSDSAQTPPKKDAEGAVTWDISLVGSMLGPEDVLPLRLLSPGEDAEVWQYQNGQWVALDTTRSGQYLLITMEGTQGAFFLQPKGNDSWTTVLLTVGGAAGLGALVVIARKVWRKKKTSKLCKGCPHRGTT